LDRIGEPVQVFYVGTSPYKHWKRLVAFSDGLVSMLVPRSVKTLSKDVWYSAHWNQCYRLVCQWELPY